MRPSCASLRVVRDDRGANTPHRRREAVVKANVLLVASLSTLVALSLAGTSSESVTTTTSRICLGASEPKYQPARGFAGAQYNVKAVGAVTCTFAISWMRRLAVKPIGTNPTALAGPAGWRCTGLASGPGYPLKTRTGICKKGSIRFTWSPRTASVA